ncbi:MAG: ImmA/IrrE family metallo-endopeptidase [Anaerostipes sp.]|nr:ImmA/IrrE family metallo-endopeptidase [Anaerostipes sp.]
MKRNDIKNIVNYYTKKFETRNPFEIAKAMGIVVQIGQLGSKCGAYMYLKRHRCIFLNEDLNEHEMELVMSHELAHAILHRTENCYFIRNKTLLLTSKIECEANTFAMDLLISDDALVEYQEFNLDQISVALGYDKKLISLKLR